MLIITLKLSLQDYWLDLLMPVFRTFKTSWIAQEKRVHSKSLNASARRREGNGFDARPKTKDIES